MNRQQFNIFHNSALKFITVDAIESSRQANIYFRKKNFQKLPSLHLGKINFGGFESSTESSYQNNQFGRRKINNTPTTDRPLQSFLDITQEELEFKKKIKTKCLLKNLNRMQIFHRNK